LRARERAPAPQVPRLALDVNTSLGLLTLSSASGPVALFGAGTTLRRTARDHAGLSLDVRYVPPVEVGDSVVSARVQTLGGRFGSRLDLLQSERLAWGVALGAGADLVSVAPRSAKLPETALAEPSARLVPVLSGAFELRVRAAPSTCVLASVGGDVDGAERRWVIEDGRREAELFAPARLRLLVSVGFEFTVAGGARLRARGGP
jgi:hypothetical protein